MGKIKFTLNDDSGDRCFICDACGANGYPDGIWAKGHLYLCNAGNLGGHQLSLCVNCLEKLGQIAKIPQGVYETIIVL